MVSTIAPIVYRGKRIFWLLGIGAYGLGSILGSITLAGGIFLISTLIQKILPNHSPSHDYVIATTALFYGLHELRLLRMPTPQIKRQVPISWRTQYHPLKTALLYGYHLALNFTTYIPITTLYIAVLLLMRQSNLITIILGTICIGIGRTLPIIPLSWHIFSAQQADIIGDKLLTREHHVHLLNGFVLVFLASAIFI